MNKRKDVLFLEILITIVVAYSVMPVVTRIFSAYFTTYAYMGVLLITVVLVVLSRHRDSFSEFVVLLIPFIVWKIVIYAVNKPELMIWGYQSLIDFAPVVIGYFILDRLGFKDIRYFATLITAVLFITVVTTVIGLNVHPDASRVLATIEDTQGAAFIEYNWANIGGYEFVYTFTLMYPVFIYGYKRSKFHWGILLAYALLNFSLIVNSGYTTALLLFLLSTVFVFVHKSLNVRELLVYLAFAVLFIAVFWPLVSDLLQFIADRIDNNDIAYRLNALSGGRKGLAASEDDRYALYMISVNSFLDHPLFGGIFTGSYRMGGHSFILDFLSQYGLVGLAILVSMYVLIYRTFFKTYENTIGFGFIIWTFIQTLFLSTVNTGMWLTILCFFAPILFAYIEQKGAVNENILGRKLTLK